MNLNHNGVNLARKGPGILRRGENKKASMIYILLVSVAHLD